MNPETVNILNELDHFPTTQWPRPPAEDMTDEKIMAKFKAVEAKWLASKSCQDLLAKLRVMPIDAEHKAENCVCFGTGNPSGMRVGKTFEEDKKYGTKPDLGQGVVLYQIAIFRTAVDAIGMPHPSRDCELR